MQATQVLGFGRTTVGKKVIIAVTGLFGIGFLLFHMYGNLKVFSGAEHFNAYSEGLRMVGAPIFGRAQLLWLVRLVLIPSIILHVWASTSLTLQARRARPGNYAVQRTLEANYASKTMRWGGLLIAIFITYHLMHFTFGVRAVHPDFIHGDVYHNLVVGFQSLPVTLFYLLAVTVLGMHLYHGGWSMIQTLGILSPKYDKLVRRLSALLAIVVAGGFAVVPIAILAGFVR